VAFSVGREVNGAKSLDTIATIMNRQQIIAVLFAVLMVGSMVAWGATLI
jgi:surface glycoprotein (TIGR04207 family)